MWSLELNWKQALSGRLKALKAHVIMVGSILKANYPPRRILCKAESFPSKVSLSRILPGR